MSAGDVVGESEAGDVAAALSESSNVLVLSPTMDPEARTAYFDSLLPAHPANLHVLGITYTRSADDWLEEWRAATGGLPSECAIVSVDEVTRSASAAATGGGLSPTGTQVETVSSPDDLTGLGIAMGKYLSGWQGQQARPLIIVDSLTVMLQYVQLQRAFRFLHVMSNRVKAAGAISHYHLDPGAHDDQTVATLASLFDAIVELEEGEWRIRGQR
jgi:hypothetical protein